MRQLEFWFEFASTYSYPAAMRVAELARSAGVEVLWRPFLLGPIFATQGWNDSPFNIYPAKGRYMWRDLQRICRDLDLAFKKPTRFPRSGLLAARVACWFQEEAWIGEFVRQVYQANFAADQEISEASILGAILERVGQSAGHLGVANSAEAKAKLRAQTDQARALGIFGAPTWVVGGELFWGNDRLQMAIDWARESREANRC